MTDVQRVLVMPHRPRHLRQVAPKKMTLRTPDDLMLYGVMCGVIRPAEKESRERRNTKQRTGGFDPVEFAQQMRDAARARGR